MKTLKTIEDKIFSKINPAVNFSVTRYVLAIGIFVAIVVFGFICTINLGVDLLPSVNIPAVSISTSFPGANPQVIDQQITKVIEDALSTMSGITDLNSSSSVGSSRVSVSFGPNSDRNAMINQVATIIATVGRRLPTGAGTPVVQTYDPNAQPIIQFGISSNRESLDSVADYVNNTLGPVLERVDGVANVSFDGAPAKQFQVLLNPDKLRYYGITPQQVVTGITNTAVNTPIGTIVRSNSTLTFATQNIAEGIDNIRRAIVDSSRGVTVDDLGSVRNTIVSQNIARVNGIPVVLVSVQRTTDSNSVKVAESIRASIDKINLPSSYSVVFSNDTTGPITASIESTFRELITTLIVVAFIVLLFLGKLNTAFSVILAIPIALAAAPILYQFLGFSFNLVSLLALIIAIGIVVDDSIVVAENVARYRAKGLGLKESVLKGASEVFSAIVAASLSLLAVLIPVSFVGGVIARYLMQFSLGLAAAVLFSLLEAILFLTVRLAYTPEGEPHTWTDFFKSFLRIKTAFTWGFTNFRKALGIVVLIAAASALLYFKLYAWFPALLAYPVVLSIGNYVLVIVLYFAEALTATLHGITEFVLDKTRNAYAHSLSNLLKRSVLVLAGAGVFLAVSAFIMFRVAPIPFNFIPQTDSGSINANIRFPRGTPDYMISEGAGRVERFFMNQPEVVSVQTVISGGSRILVRLVPNEKRQNINILAQNYRRALAPLFSDQPSVRVSVGTGGGFGGGGFGGGTSISFNVSAADYNLLTDSNAKILDAIQANQYVVDVNSSISDASLENDFVPDPAKLKGTGITPSAIAQTLQTFASGSQATNIISGGLSYPLRVMIDPVRITGTQSLLSLPIFSNTLQTNLQLGQLGEFKLNVTPTSLSRSNRQYVANMDVNLRADAPPALKMQAELTDNLRKAGLLENGISVTAGSRFGFTSLSNDLATTGWQIFILALFLVYLVMAAQFNSWRYPIYLLLPVPLAVIGALWLIFIIGGGFDIFGLMGLLMLIGLSAKNAILYLDFVVERMKRMPLLDALIEAALLRFRPIVMTTLTVFVISFPLIFSSGQGSEYGQRMGIVMLGGILFSAVLTFFVVPAAFFIFEKRSAERMLTVTRPEPETIKTNGRQKANGKSKNGNGSADVKKTTYRAQVPK